MGEKSIVPSYSKSHVPSSLEAPSTLLDDIVHGRDRDHAISGLVANLARSDYSITNLLNDVARLKETIAKGELSTDRLVTEWTALDQSVGKCLAATALSHEKFIERTTHAFCHYDQSGIILSANQRMLDLNPDCVGRPLTDYLEDMSTQVQNAISDGSQASFDLQMRTIRGELPVLAEFGRIQTESDASGYALLLDVSDRVRAERKALEAAAFGMLKLDGKHRIVYATEKAQDLLESSLDDLRGVNARQLLDEIGDRQSQLKIEQEGIARRQGHGGEYNLVITRPKSRKQTQIRVSSMPLFDSAGNFSGSIARLEPIDQALARETLARLVATESNFNTLYDNIVGVLKQFIDFEWANLFVYSPNREYSRLVCSYGPEIQFESRWFPTRVSNTDWLDQPDTFIDDLRMYDPEALNTPDMQRALAAGMRALLIIPIRQGGRLIGGICLCSRQPGAYSQKSRRILEELLLEQALLPVFHLIEVAERDFVNNLIKKLSNIEHLQPLAKCVVDGLAEFYDFQNVSMFKVNLLRAEFNLLAQALGTTDAMPMPEDYTQPIEEGTLGECLKRGDYVILSDVQGSSEEAQIYVNPFGEAERTEWKARSELSIPIHLFGRILWILNIEDNRKDAFTVLEVETLKRVIDQIQRILERIFQNTMLTQVLDVCPGAIVLTTQNGKILRYNKDALQILQFDSMPQDDNLARYLRSPLEDISTEPVNTKTVGAGQLPVQVSRFTLDEEYDHFVYLIQDVTDLNWSMNFEKLKSVIAETTAQVRVPVSLLSTYVRRLDQQVKGVQLRDLTRKAMRQLDRIELTYDRVFASYNKNALPAGQATSFEIGHLINPILSDLPSLERKTITVPKKMDLSVCADPYRIQFALNSMLSYLLRSRSSSENIAIEVSEAGAMAEIAMTGAVRANNDIGDLAALVNATRAEIGLARNVLAQIAKDAGGEFKSRRMKDRERLSLRLPTAPVAR